MLSQEGFRVKNLYQIQHAGDRWLAVATSEVGSRMEKGEKAAFILFHESKHFIDDLKHNESFFFFLKTIPDIWSCDLHVFWTGSKINQ